MHGHSSCGFVMGHSTAGEVIGTHFETKQECKHFLGYWQTLHASAKWSDIFNTWYSIYYDRDDKFTGSLTDWNYNELSIEDDTPSLLSHVTNTVKRFFNL